MAADTAKPVMPDLIDINDGRLISPIVRERAPFLLVAALVMILPHIVSLEQLPKDACVFLGFTGIPCPFCGLTRSLWAAAHGNWLWSFTFAPLGGLVYLGATLFSAIVMLEIVIGRLIIPVFGNRFVGWTAVSVLLLNWVVQLAKHF
jgi:hypothetical protein